MSCRARSQRSQRGRVADTAVALGDWNGDKKEAMAPPIGAYFELRFRDKQGHKVTVESGLLSS